MRVKPPEEALNTLEENVMTTRARAKELIGEEGVAKLAEADLVVVPAWVLKMFVKVLEP